MKWIGMSVIAALIGIAPVAADVDAALQGACDAPAASSAVVRVVRLSPARAQAVPVTQAASDAAAMVVIQRLLLGTEPSLFYSGFGMNGE